MQISKKKQGSRSRNSDMTTLMQFEIAMAATIKSQNTIKLMKVFAGSELVSSNMRAY